MKLGLHIPLKYKFLGVMLFILFLSLGLFFYFATTTFSEDKKLFVMELNMASLKAATSDAKLELKSRLEELQVFVPRVYNPASVGMTEKDDIFQGLPERFKDEILSVGIFRRAANNTFTTLKQYRNSGLLSKRFLTDDAFKTIEQTHPIPLMTYAETNGEILNRSIKTTGQRGPVELGILSFVVSGAFVNDDSKDILVVIDLVQDFLRKRLSEYETAQVFLIFKKGTLLSHSSLGATVAYAQTPLPHPIVQKFAAKTLPRESFELDIDGESYLVNVSETGFKDIYAVSQIRKNEAFLALRVLLEKSAIIALIILTLAILFSILFSERLTANIRRLKDAAELIGTGQLKVKINVRSNDEIQSVAESFQWMADRIKQLISETAEKARLEDELETARLVQSTLLTAPDIFSDCLELAYHYQPATECGGDFWDATLSNNTVTIFIGDATGHGAPAAIVTAVAKSCFSTLGAIYQDQILTPEQLLAILNQIIYASCKGKLLMTMCVVQLNLETGDLLLCNAGHESPLCVRANNVKNTGASADKKNEKAEVLFARGERLGFNPENQYESVRYQLGVGDTLLLYTDGISEAKGSDGKEWGERNIKKTLGLLAGKAPSAMKTGLVEQLNAHTKEVQQDDDITFVLLKWKKQMKGTAAPPPAQAPPVQETPVAVQETPPAVNDGSQLKVAGDADDREEVTRHRLADMPELDIGDEPLELDDKNKPTMIRVKQHRTMGNQAKKIELPQEDLVCGLFSKKEAAHLVSSGVRHLHSSNLAAKDASAKVTKEFLEKKTCSEYPWEISERKFEHVLRTSAERYDFIQNIGKREGIAAKRDLRERFETAMEELLSNAIYHSYRKPDGNPRYSRKETVELQENELVTVSIAHNSEGIYLKVKDQGGALRFADVSRAFTRCYATTDQIDTKESGAGLGVYMVFECSSHLKIVSEPGVSTTISCWLASGASFDPDAFSFNFFERR